MRVPNRVLLMGILNVTPDSFYDGGRHRSLSKALDRAKQMAEEGADIIDVGGESTRPGSRPVSLEEEILRVLPIVRAIRKKIPRMTLSVDTQKSAVARASLEEGVSIVNDVSALTQDPQMLPVVLKYRPKVVLMHMKGNPMTMQARARYRNITLEIIRFLSGRIQRLTAQGFPKKNIIVDPGIGFGKKLEHNLEILYNVKKFRSLGCPVLIGASRKSFIGALLEKGGKIPPPEERLEGSLAAALWSASQGASILRVHDVGATRRAIDVLQAITK